jgi:hypothetical protein
MDKIPFFNAEATLLEAPNNGFKLGTLFSSISVGTPII